MFDTMTMTKILGAFCGALLFFLLGSWAADALYRTGAGGHGGEEVVQGYLIETAADDSAEVEEEGPSFAELLAAADPAKGEKVFGKCKACHKVEDGANSTGPHLFAVVDRDIASVAGFSYSDVLNGMDGGWTPEALDHFIENPKGFAPGTKMSFSGLKKVEERADLVAYLQTIGG